VPAAPSAPVAPPVAQAPAAPPPETTNVPPVPAAAQAPVSDQSTLDNRVDVGSQPAPVTAGQGGAVEVDIGEAGFLKSDTGGNVIVFKNQDAMSKVGQLSRAGADTSVLVPYVACIVPDNTKVLVTADGFSGAFKSGFFGTRTVIVIAGQDAGCKGVVDKKRVQK
jgi:hypothetical protein